MKNHKLLLASFLVTSSVFGQQVISSQGTTLTTSSGSVDFTLGEVVISTLSTSSNDLTQGFHQTTWNIASIEDFMPEFLITVFPNPMETELIIETEKYEDVNFQLIDNSGKLIQEGYLIEEKTVIDVSDYSTGAYQLRLRDGNKNPLKNIKLIKAQN